MLVDKLCRVGDYAYKEKTAKTMFWRKKSVYSVTRLFFELFMHLRPGHIILVTELKLGKYRWLGCLCYIYFVCHNYNIA